MHPSNFSFQLREKEREMDRGSVIGDLPYIIVLLSKDKGGAYGYQVMRRIREEFHVPTGPSDVYPRFEELEKQGVLSPTDVKINGRYRKVYSPVEPNASELLKTYFRSKDAFDSKINRLRSRIERNNSDIQVMMCVPDAAIRCNKWINRSHIRREGLA